MKKYYVNYGKFEAKTHKGDTWTQDDVRNAIVNTDDALDHSEKFDTLEDAQKFAKTCDVDMYEVQGFYNNTLMMISACEIEEVEIQEVKEECWCDVIETFYPEFHPVTKNEYKIEFITKEMAGDFFNYLYAGEWSDFDETIEAEDEEEAEMLFKQYLREIGEDEDNYLIKVKEWED